jgi:hypothetical protein
VRVPARPFRTSRCMTATRSGLASAG